MPACNRCGWTDRFRMIGLMSRWFAAPAGLALEGGYFYLCPACFDECIQPRWELILDGLLEHQRPPQPPRAPEPQADSVAPAPPEATAAAAPHEVVPGPTAAGPAVVPPAPTPTVTPEPPFAAEPGPQAAD